MIQIDLLHIGKKYQSNRWILNDLNYTFSSPKRYGVSGPNGSGKTTLLKILAGYLSPTEGKVVYKKDDKQTHRDDIYKEVNFSAANEFLINEFTLTEMVHFHCNFKPLLPQWTETKLLDVLQLDNHKHKPLAEFSSGMLQRVKLALCCISAGSIYLLDEPTSYLDEQSIIWYKDLLLKTERPERLLFISSNQPDDFVGCDEIISTN